MDGSFGVCAVFLLPVFVGDVVGATPSGKELAVAALFEIVSALVGVMAYTCHRPHIVDGPDKFLTHLVELAYAIAVHQSLIYPTETHDVGLLYPRMTVDVDGEVACRDLENIVVVETYRRKQAQPFETEGKRTERPGGDDRYVVLVGGLGEDHHARVYADASQRLHQTECHDGCSSESVGMVDEYHFFASEIFGQCCGGVGFCLRLLIHFFVE